MEQYFNIRYEFDKNEVFRQIDSKLKEDSPGYICVADGVILNTVNRDEAYRKVVDGSMFSICDSSWVPLYVRLIYGVKREQYCGSMIFKDIVSMKDSDGRSKYRMAFLGTSTATLEALRENLSKSMNSEVENMMFYELPFCNADEFDYPAIAKMVEEDGADIIWVALGAPKQEIFMNKLNGYLHRGVQIAVGAAFKFYSGTDEKRAPEWMIKSHLEFLYRIFQDPKKQLSRCAWIVIMLPKLFIEEIGRKWRTNRNK